MQNSFDSRGWSAQNICREAGALALDYFRKPEQLQISQKGHQDWVSQADENVELKIRELLQAAWPDDGIVGEEHEPLQGSSGFKWIIDPIDGTTNFLNGLPVWSVVLAGVYDGKTEIGVIYDPNHDEMFFARKGQGATLNGRKMHVREDVPLNAATISVGYSGRLMTDDINAIVQAVTATGAVMQRSGSGAISIAYTASGRYVGYVEQHMNAWDCLAGQLLVAEAGGLIEEQDAEEMIESGGRVIAGSKTVFPDLLAIGNQLWTAK